MSTTDANPEVPPAEPALPARRWVRTILTWVLLGASVTALLWAGVWRLSGGHWERVETPSMGTTAPVGTLLWVEQVPYDQLRVGDFISFKPPGRQGVTFSHRIVAVNTDGSLSTKGDIAGVDPWRLHRGDVVGRVVMRWWDVGWLVQAAPVLLLGGVVVALVRWRVSLSWRLPVAIVGAALVVCIAIVVYRPLTRAEQLSFRPVHGVAQATYVSTGMLPIRLSALSGGHADMRAGQRGTVLSMKRDAHGRYPVRVEPNLPWWWWLPVVGVCFLPALWTVVIGRAPAAPPRHIRAS